MSKKRITLALAGFVTVSQVYAGDFCRIKQRRVAKQQASCHTEPVSGYNCTAASNCLPTSSWYQASSCVPGNGGHTSGEASPVADTIHSEAHTSEQSVAPVAPVAPAQNSVIEPNNVVAPPSQNDVQTPNRPPITEEPGEVEEELRRSRDGVNMSPPQMRKWSDSSDKFHAVAKLQEVEEDAVSLVKENGETVRVRLNRLSQVDQLYVKSFPRNVSSVLVSDVAEDER